MEQLRRAAFAVPGLGTAAVHRQLYLSGTLRRGRRPIALVYGNCQAEALRRILDTHPGLAASYQLLRVPAVHEISARELWMLRRLLPRVEVLITQRVKSDYRGMQLGTDQLAAELPAGATVISYPVVYFDGIFPFHVYVNKNDDPISTPAAISDYHDLRTLHAAGQGWDTPTTLRWLAEFDPDPAWVRANAEASLDTLRRREASLTVRLADVIRREDRLTSSFNTINHPANVLITEMARQVLERLGYPDAELVTGSTQTYLDHMKAPREGRILRAFGVPPETDGATEEWITSAGTFPTAEVVAAHLDQYAKDPELLQAGLVKHAGRLAELDFSGARW
jgi:hypothetical protein